MTHFSNRAVLSEHKAAVYALCAGEEEHLFYSGGSDRYVIRWNLEKMEAEKVVSKSPTTIVSLLYLKEYNYLFIGQIEGGVHIIDLSQGKEVKYLRSHKGYIFDIKYIKEKKEVVFSSGDGEISVWSVPDFKLLFQSKIGEGKNRKLAYSSERKELAVASADGFVQVLSTEDWSKKYKVEELESGANSVAYLKDRLLIGTKNAHLHSFDLITQLKEEGIPAHNWAIYDIASSANETVFATASRDKTVKIWDTESMEVLKRFEGLKDKGHTHSANVLLWSSYKNYLLSAGDDMKIRVWKL